MNLQKILTLTESSLEGSKLYRKVYPNGTVEELQTMFDEHCSDAEWMIETNDPFYRGATRDVAGFEIVDTTLSARKSEHGAFGNYYTLFLDNHPHRTTWPKRSKSLIATTDRVFAGNYGNISIVIPFNGAKIGAVGARDIWLSSTHSDAGVYTLKEANRTWGTFVGAPWKIIETPDRPIPFPSDTDWESWKKFDAALRQYSEDEINHVGESTRALSRGDFQKFVGYIAQNGVLNTITAMYSVSAMHPTQFTDTTKDGEFDGEVWVEGKCLVISRKLWDELLKGKR